MELANEAKEMQEKARTADQECSDKRDAYEQSVEAVMGCLRDHERRRSKHAED
jgi:hypothetical protein